MDELRRLPCVLAIQFDCGNWNLMRMLIACEVHDHLHHQLAGLSSVHHSAYYLGLTTTTMPKHDVPTNIDLYDGSMLDAVLHYLHQWVRRAEHKLPLGYNWPFIVTVDLSVLTIGGVAVAQRPVSDWPVATLALAIAFTPGALFVLFSAPMFDGPWLWAAWTSATALLLFATSTPISGDFAPVLLTLTVGVVGALTTLYGGVLATISALTLLVLAWAFNRLETPFLYIAFVGIGWLVGYLMRCQRQLLIEQRHTQAQLANHAAAEERRRVAREVHDVVAHSLSITLLHLTAARHRLQYDRNDDAAVTALEQAEQLGRHAMADIRQTVGLLSDDGAQLTPEPGACDIPCLTEDFARAGMNITVDVRGNLDRVTGATGLALYRITQESLANIVKHAPNAAVEMTLLVSETDVTLDIVNANPHGLTGNATTDGRGLRGMRQRVELLGGVIVVGPCSKGWAVQVSIPIGDRDQLLRRGCSL
ncbi:signal transduction histidine kinase [Mycobacterium sp. MAA66]|uniref:sensor histidine kinase n=1 Tax=Mycobacterium sp. MAA66 TaxID=3156297 RepID=UPI0035131BF3